MIKIINIIIGILILLAGFYLIINLSSDSIKNFEDNNKKTIIKNYYNNQNTYVLTGEFNTQRNCIIKTYKDNTLINNTITPYKNLLNIQFNVSAIGEYEFKIKCCTIKNECIQENLKFNQTP
jgi:hypothetical protein